MDLPPRRGAYPGARRRPPARWRGSRGRSRSQPLAPTGAAGRTGFQGFHPWRVLSHADGSGRIVGQLGEHVDPDRVELPLEEGDGLLELLDQAVAAVGVVRARAASADL